MNDMGRQEERKEWGGTREREEVRRLGVSKCVMWGMDRAMMTGRCKGEWVMGRSEVSGEGCGEG